MKKIYLIILISLPLLVLSQEKPEKLVQFSGLVITKAGSRPIPYASIKIKSTYRGTIANTQGFYSLVIKSSDTVIVSAVGFKRKVLYLPDSFNGNSFSTLISMEADTLTFKETLIYPWPSPANFKSAFLATNPDKTYYDLAKENLSQERMLRLYLNMKMDGTENQRLYLQQKAIGAGYLGGQTNYAQFPGLNTPVPLSLLDPFAWAKFIKMLRDGGFKDKYKEYRE